MTKINYLHDFPGVIFMPPYCKNHSINQNFVIRIKTLCHIGYVMLMDVSVQNCIGVISTYNTCAITITVKCISILDRDVGT